MNVVYKCIVVGELNGRPLPQRSNCVYFCNHAIYRLDFVCGRYTNRRSAELAAERASSLGLNCQAVRAFPIEQVKPRHGGVVPIKTPPSLALHLPTPPALFPPVGP